MKKFASCRRLFLAALILSLSVTPVYGASRKDVENARGEMNSLEAEKKKTEAAIRELESLKNDTEAYVRKLDSQLAALEEEVSGLEEEIRETEKNIEEKTAELEEAKETEAHQYESMKLRIKYMYEKSECSYLDLLFQSASMSEFLNRAEYISRISEYDRRMLDTYAEVKNSISVDREELEQEKAELEQLCQETEARKASVETLVNEKTAEIQRVSSEIGEKTEEAKAYEQDIRAQEEKIRKIEEEIRRQEEEERKKAEAAGKKYNTVSIGNISFKWPCPASSRITSGFGKRKSPVKGASTFHKGIDIGAPTGTEIIAAAGGTVTIATYSYSAGNYVMINHGGGVSTVYMHCSKLLVSPGDKVEKGQVIAKVGSTGYSTGPHLHFGIRVNGDYVNPSDYVSP